MKLIKIFSFIVAGTLVTNILIKFASLAISEGNPEVLMHPITALVLPILGLIISYLLVTRLFAWFPDNYQDSAMWIWITYLLQPIALKLYFEMEQPEISDIKMSGVGLFYALCMNAILAFTVSRKVISDEQKTNDTMDKAVKQSSQEKVVQELQFNTFAPKKRLTKAETSVHLPVGGTRDIKGNVEQESESDNFAPKKPLTTADSNIDLPISVANDEEFYKIALDEHDDGELNAATWAKAITLCAGDKEAAKWKYVELRVEGLKLQFGWGR